MRLANIEQLARRDPVPRVRSSRQDAATGAWIVDFLACLASVSHLKYRPFKVVCPQCFDGRIVGGNPGGVSRLGGSWRSVSEPQRTGELCRVDSGPRLQVVVEVRPARRSVFDRDARERGTARAMAASGLL